MKDNHPLNNLSKGELRHLYLHLQEAHDRLNRAREILDQHDIIDEWDGDYGFEYTFTDGQTQVGTSYSSVARAYNNRQTDD